MTFCQKCFSSLEEARVSIGLKPFEFIKKQGKREDYWYAQLEVEAPKIDLYIYNDEAFLELDGVHWKPFEKYDFSSEDELIQKFIEYLVCVVYNKDKKNLIDAILFWAKPLGEREALIKHSLSLYEESVHMLPFKEGASSLEIKVRNSTFDVCFGEKACFENVALDSDLALRICAAIRCGNIKENVWCFGNRVTRTRGSLDLGNGGKYFWDTGVFFAGLFKCFLKKKERRYTPWF